MNPSNKNLMGHTYSSNIYPVFLKSSSNDAQRFSEKFEMGGYIYGTQSSDL